AATGANRSVALCRRALSSLAAFFFQAEDGIRDFHVTGVQTCALPISHVAGGGLFQFGYRRASVFALGMIGTGGDYASRLAGGGLAVRLATVGPLELGAFGGYGLYAEKGWSGIERDAGGVLAGAMVSARLGSFTVALAFSD